MDKTIAKVGLMAGKRGVVLGVANDKSIAWGIAQAVAAQGGELAFTYQSDALKRRVEPLASSVGSDLLLQCDVEEDGAVARVFEEVGKQWPKIDFVVHSLAYSDRNELNGRYIETSRENFSRSLLISAYSLTEVARHAAPMMTEGGSILTLTFLGSQRSLPNYNVMGVAKAALESSVRYLANDLGPQGIRVNAISPGPMRTISGAAIGSARRIFRESEQAAPLGRNASLEEAGNTGLYFLSDLSSGVTAGIHYVDGGFHSIGLGQHEAGTT